MTAEGKQKGDDFDSLWSCYHQFCSRFSAYGQTHVLNLPHKWGRNQQSGVRTRVTYSIALLHNYFFMVSKCNFTKILKHKSMKANIEVSWSNQQENSWWFTTKHNMWYILYKVDLPSFSVSQPSVLHDSKCSQRFSDEFLSAVCNLLRDPTSLLRSCPLEGDILINMIYGLIYL